MEEVFAIRFYGYKNRDLCGYGVVAGAHLTSNQEACVGWIPTIRTYYHGSSKKIEPWILPRDAVKPVI